VLNIVYKNMRAYSKVQNNVVASDKIVVSLWKICFLMCGF